MYSYLILYKRQICFCKHCYRSRLRFNNWLHKKSGSSAATKFGVKFLISCLCIFGVESINITSLLYDDELHMLKSNKIYVMLCYVMLCYVMLCYIIRIVKVHIYIYFILFVWNPAFYVSFSLRLGSGHCLVV